MHIDCPDCYTLINGICIYDISLPGCATPEICNPNDCINITGIDNITCNGVYILTATRVMFYDECQYGTDDRLVYLSSAGSTTSDFYVQSTIIIPAGQASINFEINVFANAVGIIVVEGT